MVFTSHEFVDVNVGLNRLLVFITFPSRGGFCGISVDSKGQGLGALGSRELSGGREYKCCVSDILWLEVNSKKGILR